MASVSETRRRIMEEEDFIASGNHGNSITELIACHPEGVNNARIAKFLMLESEDEVEGIYQTALRKLRDLMCN